MDLDLTNEQEVLRKSVRNFAETVVKPQVIELDEKEEFSVELTRRMASELGLFGICIPEEFGGAGMDILSYIIAVEELARVDGSTAATVAAGNSLGIGPIYSFGTDAQKKRYLPRLCRGEILASFGLTEPGAGSDAQASKTAAVRDGDHWVLNGAKIFITNASNPLAGVTVVQAITGKRGDNKNELSCFLVDHPTKGFTTKTMHGKMMWRSSDTAELSFDNVRLPGDALLGKQGDGFKQMMQTLDGGRLSIAAMGLGGAQGAYEAAFAYAKERIAFGRPISQFQAVAFKLADMAMEIEAARCLLYKACWLKDQGRPYGKESAMAKLYCSEVMKRATTEAVQIHGGYGLMKEYHIERFFRDQKLLEIGEGTSEILRLVISRHLGC